MLPFGLHMGAVATSSFVCPVWEGKNNYHGRFEDRGPERTFVIARTFVFCECFKDDFYNGFFIFPLNSARDDISDRTRLPLHLANWLRSPVTGSELAMRDREVQKLAGI